MKILLALALAALPSLVLAKASSAPEPERAARPHLPQVSVPCLQPKQELRYVVTWWIENTRTGERRDVSAQEVRRRC